MKSITRLLQLIISITILTGILPQSAVHASTPFKKHTAPGEINICDFDIGEQGETYSGYQTDTWQGKYNYRGTDIKMNFYDDNVGVIIGFNAGEWTKYTLQVEKAGNYIISAYYATTNTDATTKITFDDTQGIQNVLETSGTWQDYTVTEIGTVFLSEGTHVMKIEQVKRGINFRSVIIESADEIKVDFSRKEGAYRTHNIPCVIQAEDYDLGANGSYSVDGENNLRKYRKNDPLDIGEIVKNEEYYLALQDKEYAVYTVENEVANSFKISLNSATTSGVKLYIDDYKYPMTADVVGTGSYAPNEVGRVWLCEGQHKIKLEASSQLNVDSIRIEITNDGAIDPAILDYDSYPPKEQESEDADTEEKANPVWRELYVSNSGNDENDGSEAAPFKTLEAANEAVKKIRSEMQGDIVINIASGYYPISEKLKIGADGAGANGYRVIYRGDENDLPIISGGVKITGWEKVDDRIWSAPADIDDTRAFFVNDQATVRARSKYLYLASDWYVDKTSKYAADGMIIPNVNFPKNLKKPAELELVWDSEWTLHRYPVADILYEQDNVIMMMDQPYWSSLKQKTSAPNDPGPSKAFYIENARELLDESGEFYFDKDEKRIYYYPFASEDMTTAECYAAVTEMLVEAKGGGLDDRIDGLSFENLRFKYGAWNEVSKTGILINQADNITNTEKGAGDELLPGQLHFEYAKNIAVKNCRFSCLGSTAIVMPNAVSESQITANVFSDIAAEAVSVGRWDHIDNLPGGADRCANIDIKNNVIRRVGEQFRGSPAIMLYYVNTVNVSHNDIKDIPYTGISLGWGWGRVVEGCANNTIAYNRIEDAVSPTHDGAHIYTLGPMRGTKIHDNWCNLSGDMRGGIYPDEGSGYLKIYNNVVQNCSNWLFARPNVRIKQVSVYDNYSDTASMSQDTVNVSVENTTVVTDGNWPDEAKKIMAYSGVTEKYSYLLDGVEKPEWRKNMVKVIPNERYKARTNEWIEAENFDKGGEGVAYHKLELGQHTNDNWVHIRPEADDVWLSPPASDSETWCVGDTKAGEWLVYTYNVAETKDYEFIIRYSNAFDVTLPDTKVSVYMDNEKIVDSLLVPRTADWYTLEELNCGTFSIPAGKHKFRIEFVDNGFSFDKWRLKSGADLTSGNESMYDEGVYVDYDETAELPKEEASFADIKGHWAEKFILRMYEAGLVSGISETEFAPNRSISLYETVWLTMRTLGIEYNDSDWRQIAYTIGLLESADEADGTVERQRFAANIMAAYMSARGQYKITVGRAPFLDMEAVNPIYDTAVRGIKEQGLMEGDNNGNFNPRSALTRAEATVVFTKLMDIMGL